MAMIKPMEITFDDIKHIIIDISLVECHCILLYILVSECPKYIYNFRRFRIWLVGRLVVFNVPSVCTQKGFCRCEYRGDYSAAFCVSGPLYRQTNRPLYVDYQTGYTFCVDMPQLLSFSCTHGRCSTAF